MNKIIALVFTFIFLFLGFFLGILGSVHGSKLLPYFDLGFVVIALGILWWLCFFIPRRKPRHAAALLTICALALGGLLVLASSAIQGPLNEWDFRQMQKRSAATQVSGMQDEVLLSERHEPVGIRLKYSIRFPDSNYYSQSPFLYPQADLGYSVGWNIVQQTIQPPMQVVTASADLVPIETAHVPPAGMRYEQGRLYAFTVDLVPEFLALSANRSTVCIVKPPAQFAPAFAKVLATDKNVLYGVTISGTNYSGKTQNTYNLKTFYDAAIKDGASECKYRNGRISFR